MLESDAFSINNLIKVKLQLSNSKYQTNSNGQNSNNVSCKKVLVIEHWNLRFFCNLVLVICIFNHKNPKQSWATLTWPREPGFCIGVNIKLKATICQRHVLCFPETCLPCGPAEKSCQSRRQRPYQTSDGRVQCIFRRPFWGYVRPGYGAPGWMTNQF